jgi:hypothetical protein
MADDMVALDAAVVAISGVVHGLQHVDWRSLEELLDLVMEKRPIDLERYEIVATPFNDLVGDIGLSGGRRAPQFEPLEQEGGWP